MRMSNKCPCTHITLICWICFRYCVAPNLIVTIIDGVYRSIIHTVYLTNIEITIMFIIYGGVSLKYCTWEYRAYHTLADYTHLTCVIGIARPWHGSRGTSRFHRTYDTCNIYLVFVGCVGCVGRSECSIIDSYITIWWQQTDYRWRIYVAIGWEWILCTSDDTAYWESMVCNIVWRRACINNATTWYLNILDSGICTNDTSQYTYIAVVGIAS